MSKEYWIVPQRKAFTKWTNVHLERRNITIHDLKTDFKNGTNLVHLLEILTSKTIPHNRTPRLEVQMMENIGKALEFCKFQEGLKLVNIGPRDIFEGNETLILGLIWQLILKYKIHKRDGSSETSASKELLEWVQKIIPSYDIKNFTTDWQNGKAICGLVEAIQPGQMTLPQDFHNDPLMDCTMGIECAKKNMGIVSLVDPEDMVNNPDSHALMTYISYFRDFASLLPLPEKDKVSNEDLPSLSHCKVYGPALQPGNQVGSETYFTIEVRNKKDLKVHPGDLDIGVRITGPHSQNQFLAKENVDGTFYVTFVPVEDGNYVIEVGLGGVPISGSPFHVTIEPVKSTFITKPVPHWFVHDKEKQKYIPYSDEDNKLIEQHFQNYGGGCLFLGDLKLDLTKNEEVNNTIKYFFHQPTRPIIRGTWFWQGDDGFWFPYDTSSAAKLEKAFQENAFNSTNVDISERNKVRHVSLFSDGQFRQFRKAQDARLTGRPVQRGYMGKVTEVEIKK